MSLGGLEQKLAALEADLTHGWKGFALVYGIVALFSIAGLKRGSAGFTHYLRWPLTSLITMLVAGLVLFFGYSAIGMLTGVHVEGELAYLLSVLFYMLAGVLGGLFWAHRGHARLATVGRGAQVFDGAQHQVAATKQRKQALKKPDRNFPLTVAGVTVPFEDETKHFKFMGTTGVGKSSAMRELLHAALYRGDRAIIADPDGGYLSRFYRPDRGDVILNPFDMRSGKWKTCRRLTTVLPRKVVLMMSAISD